VSPYGCESGEASGRFSGLYSKDKCAGIHPKYAAVCSAGDHVEGIPGKFDVIQDIARKRQEAV
jgi:hypothetical protein